MKTPKRIRQRINDTLDEVDFVKFEVEYQENSWRPSRQILTECNYKLAWCASTIMDVRNEIEEYDLPVSGRYEKKLRKLVRVLRKLKVRIDRRLPWANALSLVGNLLYTVGDTLDFLTGRVTSTYLLPTAKRLLGRHLPPPTHYDKFLPQPTRHQLRLERRHLTDY